MDFKVLRWKFFRGSLIRRLFLKTFLFALAMAIIPFIQIVHDVRIIEPLAMNFDECPLNIGSNPYLNISSYTLSAIPFPLFGLALTEPCKESENVTINVFREIRDKGLLDSSSKALSVGEGSALAELALRELGFSDVFAVDRHPFFSLMRKGFIYELDFKDNYFDFVFSRALDRVSVPALLVSEIERVLRPGGTGALLVGANNFYLGGLIRSASPVSSFLRSSNVVHIRNIGSFTLVVFKKNFDSVASFEHYKLPDKCPSVTNNKPFLKFLEPLADRKFGQLEAEISYLPRFMNMSSRNRFICINIGAGEFVTSSVEEMFKPCYTINPRVFNVYVVHNDPSVLSSYVKKLGVTFIYHPSLAGEKPTTIFDSDGNLSALHDDEGFDIIRWMKETRESGDFVVLMMNTRAVELKILFGLFESGGICDVDELFLHCSDDVDCKNSMCGDCMSLFRGLRNSGVFVHQLWGD